MSDMSRRATQVLDEARASQPKLDRRRRERVRNAVVMSVAATAASAASSAQAAGPLAGWLTTTTGKVIVGVAAALVGSGATVGVMMARRAAVTPAPVATPAPVRRVEAAVTSRPAPEPVAAVEPAPPPEALVQPEVAVVLPTVSPVVVRAPKKPAELQGSPAAPVVSAVSGARDEPAPTPPVPVPVATPIAPLVAASTSTNRVPAAEAAQPLRDELTVLRLAMTHHDSGNELAALATLDEYDGRFPKGVMVVEAQVLRVLALCQLGRTPEASAVLRALELATPASPAVQRLKTSCAAQ